MARAHRREASTGLAINVTPLVDMVFILLIFFIVTANFARESGVDVQRPSARSAQPQSQANILIGVTREGQVWIDKRRVDPRAVRGHVQRLLAETPEAAIVVVADRDSQTGTVVRVMDQARLAGASSVALAARSGDP